MARKTLKREPTAIQAASQDDPISSGDTIVMDQDVIMVNGSVDEVNSVSATKKISPSHASSPETEHGLEVLGRGVKELVQKVQSLRHLGVEDLVLPLPKIVVVGDQSTGKSSLIEGMSEIKVPRSASTCTRCPLEINLTETTGQPWSCDIFLHKKYIYQGSLGSNRPVGRSTAKIEGATKSRPLGPWVEQDSEDLHFASLTNKDRMVDALERAQLAILNPGSPYEKYKPGNLLQREYQVKFSPNVIRLDISGPSLCNLSFYDLPGVINVTDNTEEAYLVPLIKNLVREYIKAENCINLLALTMTHDAVNSNAFGLIKEMKAEARTVGCLTKPDRIDPGEALDQWVRILRGEEYQLGLGYHVIKNNPNPEVDHTTARKEEAAFFSQNEPWTTSLSMYSDRFGTLQLQMALSQQLTAQIRTSLPDIIDKVQQKADVIEAALKGLPEPLGGNLPAIVYGELLKFEGEIQNIIDGEWQDNAFQKRWHSLALDFHKVLGESRPVLMLPTPATPRQRSSNTPSSEMTGTPTPGSGRGTIPVFNVDSGSEGDCKPKPVQLSGRKRSHPSTQSTPCKVSRTAPRRTCGEYNITSRRFTLLEVRDIIHNAYIGLPNQTHPKAIERMIRLSQEHWHEPVEHFLGQAQELCQAMVFEQVLKVFGHRQQTKYYEQILGICETFFTEALVYQRQAARDLLTLELTKPNAMNSAKINNLSDKALALLQARRREIRANAYLDEQEAKSGKTTTGQARIDKLSKLTDDGKLPPDTFTQEITAMSAVKGYYEWAYDRFVDYLYASIHCGLFSKCRNEIVSMMKREFGVTEVGATERLAILLAANPEQEHRRAQLKSEMETIKKAQEQLEELTEGV